MATRRAPPAHARTQSATTRARCRTSGAERAILLTTKRPTAACRPVRGSPAHRVSKRGQRSRGAAVDGRHAGQPDRLLLALLWQHADGLRVSHQRHQRVSGVATAAADRSKCFGPARAQVPAGQHACGRPRSAHLARELSKRLRVAWQPTSTRAFHFAYCRANSHASAPASALESHQPRPGQHVCGVMAEVASPVGISPRTRRLASARRCELAQTQTAFEKAIRGSACTAARAASSALRPRAHARDQQGTQNPQLARLLLNSQASVGGPRRLRAARRANSWAHARPRAPAWAGGPVVA